MSQLKLLGRLLKFMKPISENKSNFITGSLFKIDGGQTKGLFVVKNYLEIYMVKKNTSYRLSQKTHHLFDKEYGLEKKFRT